MAASFDSKIILQPQLGVSVEKRQAFDSYFAEVESNLPTSSYYLSKKDGAPIPFLCEITPDQKTIYLALDTIDKGLNSHVRFGADLEGRIIVLKLLPKTGDHITEEALEVCSLLPTLEKASEFFVCGNWFTYLKFSEKKVIEKIAFTLPYISGQDLFSVYQSGKLASNRQLYPIALQMAKAVEYLQRHGFVHGDIKPENFLQDENGRVFLIDFGISSRQGKEIKVGTGSPAYIDPDDFKKPPRTTTISSFARDIWALGCTYAVFKKHGNFQDFSGQIGSDTKPADNDKLADMSRKAFEWHKGQIFPNRRNESSFEFVIDQCLQLKPRDRISIRPLIYLIDELIESRTSSLKID